MTTVKRHPPQVIEALLRWCELNFLVEPFDVFALGLPYANGLNAHQLAAARFVEGDTTVAIRHPLAPIARSARMNSRSRSEST